MQIFIQCLFIVHTKCQNVPEKNMEGDEFLIQALSKQYVELQRVVTLKDLNHSLDSIHIININVHVNLMNFHH